MKIPLSNNVFENCRRQVAVRRSSQTVSQRSRDGK